MFLKNTFRMPEIFLYLYFVRQKHELLCWVDFGEALRLVLQFFSMYPAMYQDMVIVVIVNLYSAFMWSHPKRARYEISTEKTDKT